MNPLLKAVAIAANAHLTHAPDKGGSPYILHPLSLEPDPQMRAVLLDVARAAKGESCP